LVWALVSFGIGVFFALASSMLGYLSQLDAAVSVNKEKREIAVRWCAIGAAGASGAAFLVGLFFGAVSFSLGFH
jgi:hypothetical protein